MKKLLLLVLVAVTFIACEGPTGPMGPSGHDGQNGMNGQDGKDGQNGLDGKDGENGTNWYVTSFTIQPNEWELVGKAGDLNSYFFVDKPLSNLSEFIYKEGAVIGYIENVSGVKNGLPYVLHRGGEDDKGEFLWTETADFDFYPGGVGFYLTYSDFNTQLRPDKAKIFHIVLMW